MPSLPLTFQKTKPKHWWIRLAQAQEKAEFFLFSFHLFSFLCFTFLWGKWEPGVWDFRLMIECCFSLAYPTPSPSTTPTILRPGKCEYICSQLFLRGKHRFVTPLSHSVFFARVVNFTGKFLSRTWKEGNKSNFSWAKSHCLSIHGFSVALLLSRKYVSKSCFCFPRLIAKISRYKK